jgi:hypothetical protein
VGSLNLKLDAKSDDIRYRFIQGSGRQSCVLLYVQLRCCILRPAPEYCFAQVRLELVFDVSTDPMPSFIYSKDGLLVGYTVGVLVGLQGRFLIRLRRNLPTSSFLASIWGSILTD